MLNVNLSYNPPSSWNIMFSLGDVPGSEFIWKFQGPGRYRRGRLWGYIYSREISELRFTFNSSVIIDKRRKCTGSVYPCIQTKKYSPKIDVHTVYMGYQMTQTPSLANPPTYDCPRDPPFWGFLTESLTTVITVSTPVISWSLTNF